MLHLQCLDVSWLVSVVITLGETACDCASLGPFTPPCGGAEREAALAQLISNQHRDGTWATRGRGKACSVTSSFCLAAQTTGQRARTVPLTRG